jgi:hypothetical protein
MSTTQSTNTAASGQSTRTGGLGEMTHYILITIDLAEQKAVAVKFCKDQAELSFYQQMFKDDFGDGFVTFAHAYDVPNA